MCGYKTQTPAQGILSAIDTFHSVESRGVTYLESMSLRNAPSSLWVGHWPMRTQNPCGGPSFLRARRSHEGFARFRSQTHLTAPSNIQGRLSVGIFLSLAFDKFFLNGVKSRSICAVQFL